MIAESDKWQVAIVQSLTGEWFAKARLGPHEVDELGRKFHRHYLYTTYLPSKEKAADAIAEKIEQHNT